jgi:crotonobetainyl-CoA:carnitine CoA-transferase CaiB-like acyl-CoA transferase
MHCTLCDWTSLLEWVKADGMAQDLGEPAWEDLQHRRTNCRHLFDVLDAWAKEYAVADLVEAAQLRRIPFAPLLSPEMLATHPQLVGRRFFVPVQHDELGQQLLYPGAPYVFSKTPWRLRRRPPLIGEHTDEVFAEWTSVRPAPSEFGDCLGRRAPTPSAHAARASTWRANSAQPAPAHGAARSLELAGPLDAQDAANSTPDPQPTSLRGVRVIDFTWVIAGPVATRVLADHGAEVIKVERRDTPDLGSRRAGLTGALNRGKQSLVVDMNAPQGMALVRRLIAAADVVVDNFSARVMHNWGLDYDSLRRLRPDIIALSMSGFGQTGPYRDYVSYGPTLQAMAGYSLTMRHPGGEPAGWGFSYSDTAAGHAGALAILIALWHRQRTGEGQYIDLSQFENLAALLGPSLLDALVHHRVISALGNSSQEMPAGPHGVYRCADLPGDGPARDRWCAVAVFGEADWRRFRRALGNPRWATDDRFATERARLTHRTALDAHITAWTRTRRAEDVMAELQAAGIAAGVVANAADLCRRDPHVRARGYWTRINTPEGQSHEFDRPPFRMSLTPGGVQGPGPLLGEHTDAVLRRVLGLTPSALTELRAAGAIG